MSTDDRTAREHRNDDTLLDRFIRAAKNRRVIAVILILTPIIIAAAELTGSIQKLRAFFFPAPALVAQEDHFETPEDSQRTCNILDNDRGIDPKIAIVAIDTTGTKGRVLIDNQNQAVYTPPSNFNGEDTFKYRVDYGTAHAEAFVHVNVTPVNDPPLCPRIEKRVSVLDLPILIDVVAEATNNTRKDPENQILELVDFTFNSPLQHVETNAVKEVIRAIELVLEADPRDKSVKFNPPKEFLIPGGALVAGKVEEADIERLRGCLVFLPTWILRNHQTLASQEELLITVRYTLQEAPAGAKSTGDLLLRVENPIVVRFEGKDPERKRDDRCASELALELHWKTNNAFSVIGKAQATPASFLFDLHQSGLRVLGLRSEMKVLGSARPPKQGYCTFSYSEPMFVLLDGTSLKCVNSISFLQGPKEDVLRPSSVHTLWIMQQLFAPFSREHVRKLLGLDQKQSN